MRSAVRAGHAGRTAAVLALATALLLTACAEPEEPGPAETEDSAQPDPEPEPEPEPEETATEDPEESGAEDPESSGGFGGPVDPDGDSGRGGVEPLAEIQLPGESSPMYFSEPGSEVDVVGLEREVDLIVRETPETVGEQVGYLVPLSSTTLAGRERSVEETQWAEITLSDGVGWVPAHNLGYLGSLTERTADFQGEAAADPEDIANSIGSAFQEGAENPRALFTIVADHQDGDLHQFVVDVLGYADDSTRGERLHILLEQAGGQYRVRSVEGTAICARGVHEGLCL